MKIYTEQAPEYLMDVLQAGLVPMLMSSPGIGKSTIAKKLAADNKLKVIDLRLSQCDPSDLLGFPTINKEHTKSGYVPMDTFPIEGDPVPIGMNGWLLLLDEFNSAPISVQAAAYKVVLDKQVGVFNLHKNVAIICAGNLSTDKAIVNRMSTAMQSRLVHFELDVNHIEWIKWADVNDIDYRIKSYIGFKPDILHNFNPNHIDHTFPCPRTWEFCSKIMSKWEHFTSQKIAVIAGTIGEGAAREFYSYCQIYTQLPDIGKIMSNPTGIEVPTEPSILHAVTGLLGYHLNPSTADKLMQFLTRMPIEFQVIGIRSAIAKDKSLMKAKSMSEWIKKFAKEIL